jgi:hypothetical protein
MHVSNLYGTPVIDDNNFAAFANSIGPDGTSTSGYRARDWSTMPLCGIQGTTEFPRELVYDEKTLKEIIEEQDRNESSLWHMLKRGPKIWRNQSPSNYCWMYATVHAMQASRIGANLPPLMLSPLSAGCPCDNFANRGGWGPQAIKWLIEHGVAEESIWPSANVNAGIRRSYYTEEAKANALQNRVFEWYDFRSRDMMAKLSAVVRGIAVSSGYSWMGHQMCTVRAVVLSNGSLGCVDLDSYGNGGDFNERVMSYSRGSGDDMVAPRVST